MIEPTRTSAEAVAEWESPAVADRTDGETPLIIEVAGYEGPLDLLLAMARTQKVDLGKISMVALAEQYLAFIANAAGLRLEVAADYLVMAAWLAYLKSRLLLPRDQTAEETASAEEMARRLAFRLVRLDAMRNAAAQLMTRKRLGIDVFARGQPEGTRTIRQTEHTAQIHDLIAAYAEMRRRTAALAAHVVKARKVWSIKEARERLEQLVGTTAGRWLQLDLFLSRYLPIADDNRTALASSFGASLEMAREGLIELRQEEPFGPLFIRQRKGGSWERVG